MTKSEATQLLQAISEAYPNFELTEARAKLWVKFMAEIPVSLANRNLEKHIEQSKYPPTIAEIRANYHMPDPVDEQVLEVQRRQAEGKYAEELQRLDGVY